MVVGWGGWGYRFKMWVDRWGNRIEVKMWSCHQTVGGLRRALWWMLGQWGAVRRADMAMVCGALPSIGKSWEGGWGRYWHIYSKSDKQLVLFPAVEGFKAWWQTASPSDGTNCHWQCLTALHHTARVILFCFVLVGKFQHLYSMCFPPLYLATLLKHILTKLKFELMYLFLRNNFLCHEN